jgi:hypothetical protein
MNLLYEAQLILEEANYYVRAGTKEDTCFFEDQSLYGFIIVSPTVADILGRWETEQDAFLKAHADTIRANPGKAWNAYSVFLTWEHSSENANAAEIKLLQIEEDFRGTRKIAGSGVVSPDDVRRALRPLLPIENKVKMTSAFPPKLEDKLSFLSQAEISALLTKGVPEVIAASLLNS